MFSSRYSFLFQRSYLRKKKNYLTQTNFKRNFLQVTSLPHHHYHHNHHHLSSSSFSLLNLFPNLSLSIHNFNSKHYHILQIQRCFTAETYSPQISDYMDKVDTLYSEIEVGLKDEKFEEMLPKCKECFELSEKAYHDGHPLRAKSATNYAFVLHQSTGNLKEAKEMYEKAFKLCRRTFGKDHFEVGHLLLNYAELLAFAGESNKAISYAQSASDILMKTYGLESEIFASCQANLASYFATLGKHSESLPLYKLALEIAKRKTGKASQFTSGILANYVRCLHILGHEKKIKVSRHVVGFFMILVAR